MDGKRIIIDAKHGHQRSRVFAILILCGLAVVFAVWFFQLHTMFRYAKLSQVSEDFAVFEEAIHERAADTSNSEAAVAAVTQAMQDLMADEAAEQKVKDAVAQGLLDALREPEAAASDESQNESGEDATTPPIGGGPIPRVDETVSE